MTSKLSVLSSMLLASGACGLAVPGDSAVARAAILSRAKAVQIARKEQRGWSTDNEVTQRYRIAVPRGTERFLLVFVGAE